MTKLTFLHIADTHFGVHYAVRPKNLLRRKYGDLFFQKAEAILNRIIKPNNVDLILHAGDFFNRSKPYSEVIKRAIQLFSTTLQKGISTYIIPGNHERSFLPVGLLKLHTNLHVFDKPGIQIFEKNGIKVKITGIPYIRRNAVDRFPKFITSIEQCNKYTPDYSILLAHQLIEGAHLENYTFLKGPNVVKFNSLNNKYNYIALGHVHRFQWMYQNDNKIMSINNKFNVIQSVNNNTWNFDQEQKFHFGPLLVYAGSVERVSFAEMNEPKGFILGELNGTKGSIQGKFRFINHNGIEMRNFSWDPEILRQEEFKELIQKEFESVSQQKNQYPIKGVFRIKIIDKSRSIPKFLVSDLKDLANEKNILLSFVYPIKKREDEK